MNASLAVARQPMRGPVGTRELQSGFEPVRTTVRVLRIGAVTLLLRLAAPVPASAQADSLQFPRDDGRHRDARFEMWSGFTHVRTARGTSYSILALFFTGRFLAFGVSGAYGAVLEPQTGTFRDDRDLVTPLLGSKRHTSGRLDERYGRSELTRDSAGGAYVVHVETGRLRFRLLLAPARGPVDLGRIPVGAGRTERSYVVPRATVSGSLEREGGVSDSVEGIGLLQHAWGDSPDRSAAEDLLAIHLDDGTDIFALTGSSQGSATLMVATDSAAGVFRQGFRLEADTARVAGPYAFRRRWHLQLEAPFMDLRVDPPTQGRRVSLLGIPYLIGRCVVRGTGPGGRPVSGVGYMYIRGREATVTGRPVEEP